MKLKEQGTLTSIVLAIIFLGSGCGPRWSMTFHAPAGEQYDFDHRDWTAYQSLAGKKGLALEKIFYDHGYRIIDSITITDQGGKQHTFPWNAGTPDSWLREDGTLVIGSKEIKPDVIRITPSAWMAKVETSITDISPTVAQALDLPLPALATGSNLVSTQADHVLLLFLDGFGYVRVKEAVQAGLIPGLSRLGEPRVGLTTYPPITTVSTASLLTGAEPRAHSVEARGVRKTDHETLLQVANQAGLDVQAVEGEALSFFLNGADYQLSGDRDQDGSTDDNVLENTLVVLEEGMPDVLLVHFHGIDDLGHKVGPGHPREEEAIRTVDRAVGQILSSLPGDTLVIVFADHGMHRVQGEERAGNHGHLIPRDMLIPIWIKYLE